jgi:hypothetical protein
MIDGMRTIIPDMRVKVETVIANSLNKKDLAPGYND